MREIRPSGSEGGGAEINRLSLPLFIGCPCGTNRIELRASSQSRTAGCPRARRSNQSRIHRQSRVGTLGSQRCVLVPMGRLTIAQFQRWVRSIEPDRMSPAGTTLVLTLRVCRPCGTRTWKCGRQPSVATLGYCQLSLWDKPQSIQRLVPRPELLDVPPETL